MRLKLTSNQVLANVLGVLIKIHGLFFKDPTNLGCQEVGTLLRKIRTQILWGCTLFFKDVENDVAVVRSRAEAMGATCKTLMDSTVTHLVTSNKTMEDFRWAEQVDSRYLVHPRWINAAHYLWHKQPEEMYFTL
ncbi:hypothetical protein Pint_15273 [Pistacia integerrima]|uniref:Uncharacterized protein n=1 Tax=Pistacia integerrima TaxID=434235 RepID=A0ACC0ZEZ9_9ROSI|nr:hypothetical protein Pint_15273 [Pistacia integerrima]